MWKRYISSNLDIGRLLICYRHLQHFISKLLHLKGEERAG